MISKKSRYQKTILFKTSETSGFTGVRPRVITTASGVLEHIITSGDRLDLLAEQYYDNTHLWWKILDANPYILYGGDLCIRENEGAIVLIPGMQT